MSLLGIDVGTTGCKAGVVTEDGRLLALAYREYETLHPQPGWAEFDSRQVWSLVKEVIAEVAHKTAADPIRALCTTSCGEAMTPVSSEREIMGNCILGHDVRGEEYAAALEQRVGRERLHAINGNVLGTPFSAPKLAWIRDHRQELFDKTDQFLLWGGLVGYLLGGEATSDLSLASRTLLLDRHTGEWSPELLQAAGIPAQKLPKVVKPGAVIGEVSPALAKELGLPAQVKIVAGGHDQCCTALGVGVVEDRQATYSIGSYICVTPTYRNPPPSPVMLRSGLNIEHHVVPGQYVSFLAILSGGAVLRWARDTLAAREKTEAATKGTDIYTQLLAEMPDAPTSLMVLPYFAPSGSADLDTGSSGVIMGLNLETSRGEIIKSLLEGVTFYIKEGMDLIGQAGLQIREFRATGGGSKSDRWLQLTADILGQPIARVGVSECGVVGAAILAGTAAGVLSSAAETARQWVQVIRTFEPDPSVHAHYQERAALYQQLYPVVKDYLHRL
jgi:xylulokinase